MMARKVVAVAAGVVGLWIAILVVAGFAYSNRAGERVARRVGDSLLATASFEDSSLSLLRGRLELANLKVRKDDLGVLAIDIATVRCELLPLGLALVNRTCRELVIDKVRLEMSSAAVLQLKKPKRRPLHVERVEIRDAVLTFSPSAFVPQLGKVEIRIDYVEAGPTTFRTPLSWIFSMRELRATLDLPADIVVKLAYKNGVLTAAGGIFGSTPIALPFALPLSSETDDAKAEIAKLVTLGTRLAEDLIEKRAKDWLKSKLTF